MASPCAVGNPVKTLTLTHTLATPLREAMYY